jgi:HEAT repeat protein
MTMTLDQMRYKLGDIEPTENMFDGISDADLPVLNQLLDDSEPWLAARAVLAIARIQTSSASVRMRRVMADSRPEVRTALAMAASYMKPATAKRTIKALLRDENVGVRKMAIMNVNKTHGAEIRRELEQMMTQETVPMLRASIEAKVQALRPRARPVR